MPMTKEGESAMAELVALSRADLKEFSDLGAFTFHCEIDIEATARAGKEVMTIKPSARLLDFLATIRTLKA